MQTVEEYDRLNSELPYCIADLASDEEKKRGIHDRHIYETYPAYPWKFDGETDHSADNPKFFYNIVRSAGLVTHVRAEDKKPEPPITYTEWAAKHPYDNNLKDLFNGT